MTSESEYLIRSIERQQKLELESVEKGVARYRRDLNKSRHSGTEADTKPGQKMMASVMSSLIPAISKRQEAAVNNYGGKAGSNLLPWHMPILCLRPEKIAYIAARTALSSIHTDRKAASLALGISYRIKEQRNLELWGEAELKNVNRAPDDQKPINLYKLMQNRSKDQSPRAIRRWMKLAEDFDKMELTPSQSAHLGMRLLWLLCENGGGWFEMKNVRTTNRGGIQTHKQLFLTETAKEFINHHHSISEISRPWLLPMVAPPAPWAYV